MASKKLFGVFFVVGMLSLTMSVAGCDQVTRLFGGGKPAVRREPKAERTLGPTSTPPSPTAAPRRTPTPDPEPTRSGNATTPTPAASATTPTPIVTTTTQWYPWLTAKGTTDTANGLTRWDIQAGGFGHKKPWGHWTFPNDRPVDDQTVVAITSVDEVVYWLVYRYQFGGQYGGWCCSGTYADVSDVDGDAFLWGERAIFRLEAIQAGVASFFLIATQSVHGGRSLEHEMGYFRGTRRGDRLEVWANPRKRAMVFLETWAVLPATPSEDVVTVSANSLHLSDHGAGRWGSDRIPFSVGPLYVPGWFLDWWWKVTERYTEIKWERSSLINSHGVGREVAFAARQYYNVETRYDSSSSHLQHPLFRFAKGEARWRALLSFPRIGSWAPYHDLVWSSLYGEPMFFIREGGFAGTVYSVSEEDAMKLP